MTNGRHVGFDQLLSERKDLLEAYDKTVRGGTGDAAKVEHGNVGKHKFREFLGLFLPKKFGVAKGYIVTPDLHEGHLEQGDITRCANPASVRETNGT